MTNGQHVVPVFILDRACEIASHLQTWSEGKPGEWFRLCFTESHGRYAVVLSPDLNRSVERFRETYRILTGGTLEAEKCQIIHVPLCFVSGREHVFEQVRGRIAEQTMLGFIDASNVKPSDRLAIGAESINLVGPFQVCWDQKPFGTVIGSLIEERIGDAESDESGI
jgi:hypothetical protein